MRKICVINQKGGVGKTTTAVNIAAGLSREGKRVLIVDLDPQGNVSSCLGHHEGKDLYDLLSENAEIKECIRNLATNFDVIPSNEDLAKSELLMIKEGKYSLLRQKLEKIDWYDYVIIDCPPSLGLMNKNALVYANEAFIPASTDVLGLEALRKMVAAIQKMNEAGEKQVIISRIIPTLFDRRNRICVECLKQIQAEFYEIVSEPIRINSKLKEAPGHNKSIFSYAKNSSGAEDYGKLVRAVIQDEEKISRMVKDEEAIKVAVRQKAEKNKKENS